jgi:sulfur relay protein TusB/DsrH
MATLHLIHTNLMTHPELAQQLNNALSVDDALLFLAQGIYSLVTPPFAFRQAMYVLKSDLQLTGLQLPDIIHPIDYDEFVNLGVRYERSLSWN